MTEINRDRDGSDDSAPSNDSALETYPPTIAGWIARLVSVTLLVGLISVIGWHAVQPSRPVAFKAELQTDEIRRVGGAYLVPVDITNIGSETALNVTVELDIEGRKTDIEMLMVGEQETKTFFLSSPTFPTSLSHRILSYEAP